MDPKHLDGAPIPELVELLTHTDPAVRADAACALGDRIRSREEKSLGDAAVRKLVELLVDGANTVRFEAAMALAECKNPAALPILLAALKKRALRLDAIRALGTLGDKQAENPLLDMLTSIFVPWADKLQAAAALCALGNARGAEYVLERVNSRRPIERAAALHFLGESRHPQARSVLESILATHNDPMRDVAARSLGLLGDPAATASLKAAQPGADQDLAADIAAALRLLGEAG